MGGRERYGGRVGEGKSLSKEETNTNTRVESSYDMYMHPQRTNIPQQGIDRRALTVGAMSDPHSRIGALLGCNFTSRGFTWSIKSILEKQTSQH